MNEIDQKKRLDSGPNEKKKSSNEGNMKRGGPSVAFKKGGKALDGKYGKSEKNSNKNKMKKVKGGTSASNGNDTYTMYSKNYKKMVCEFYRKGLCNKGEDCTYRHDIQLKTLDMLCKHHIVGSCNNPKCLFLHDTNKYPCKYLFISGKCDKGMECAFSHEKISSVEQINDFVKNNAQQIRIHRDKGILTPLSKYAMEKGLVSPRAEGASGKDNNNLIPPDIYDSSSSSSSRDDNSDDDAPDNRDRSRSREKSRFSSSDKESSEEMQQGKLNQKSTDLFIP